VRSIGFLAMRSIAAFFVIRHSLVKLMTTAFHRRIVQSLESLQAAGVQQLPKVSVEAIAAPQADTEAASNQESLNPRDASQRAAASQSVAEAASGQESSNPHALTILRDEVAACTLCEELATTRTQTVFGVGNPQARLCFLGEAPGADEDRLGEPFVGRGGQLLNKIIEACQLRREDVYLLNVLRCRPPENRNPTGEEASNCRRFLERQLQLVSPEFICCLGTVAAQNLLSTTETIGRLRGKVHDYRGLKVICTYHPAYLLRNPSAKRSAWEDMKMLMREMGTPVG